MFRKFNGRKAATLSEMCVVIAVIAIAALAVVSFTSMVSAHAKTSAVKLSAMDDLELTQTVMENWIIQAETKGSTITTDGARFHATAEDLSGSLYFENDLLIAAFPGGSVQKAELKTVTRVSFDIMENTDKLYFCTIFYEIEMPTGPDVESQYTFCVNPRTGDQIGG